MPHKDLIDQRLRLMTRFGLMLQQEIVRVRSGRDPILTSRRNAYLEALRRILAELERSRQILNTTIAT